MCEIICNAFSGMLNPAPWLVIAAWIVGVIFAVAGAIGGVCFLIWGWLEGEDRETFFYWMILVLAVVLGGSLGAIVGSVLGFVAVIYWPIVLALIAVVALLALLALALKKIFGKKKEE